MVRGCSEGSLKEDKKSTDCGASHFADSAPPQDYLNYILFNSKSLGIRIVLQIFDLKANYVCYGPLS